jgi:adenine-specific DNA glycosylase
MVGDANKFRTRLLRWYDRHRRDLPWRSPRPDPYHVLVSEAMLQQTQVATVIPYYRRFLERFPTLHQLAAADEQDVLRLWQGLGYYSRARNLREAARAVVSDHNGELPREADELIKLPGIGRYTAGGDRVDRLRPPRADIGWERRPRAVPARCDPHGSTRSRDAGDPVAPCGGNAAAPARG